MERPRYSILAACGSGGHFPQQLGMIHRYYSIPESTTPDILMGTSGGALSLATAALCSYRPIEICNVVSRMDSHMYSRPWTSLPWNLEMYLSLQFPCRNELRSDGEGFISLFNKKQLERLTDLELWIGTQDECEGGHRLVCSIEPENSALPSDTPPYHRPTLYLCNKREEIFNSLRATASLSGIVPSVSVEGFTAEEGTMKKGEFKLSDGGHECASPTPVLLRMMEKRGDNFNLTYFNRVNMKSRDPSYFRGNWLYTRLKAAQQLHESAACMEVQHLHTLFELTGKSRNYRMNELEVECPTISQQQYLSTIHQRSPLSMVEYYPLMRREIDCYQSNGSQITELMVETSHTYGVRALWASW